MAPLTNVQFPDHLKLLNISNYTYSLDNVYLPENIIQFDLIYYKSLINFKFPKNLQILNLPYNNILDNIEFPEHLRELNLFNYAFPLNCNFSHELIIIIECIINDPKFEFIKNVCCANYYTYLKYPRDHFIKPCLN